LLIQNGPSLIEKEPILETGKAYKKPLDIIEFELKDQGDQLYSKNDLKNQWTILFFGYTNCPDVCPTTIFKLGQIKQQISKELPNVNLQILFITLDPERDSTERLREYLGFFNASMIGLTGDISKIVELTSNLSVFFQRINKEDGYDFNHTASIFLMNPNAQLKASFSPASSIDMLNEDIQTVIKKSN
jgi:protein SCO1/2